MTGYLRFRVRKISLSFLLASSILASAQQIHAHRETDKEILAKIILGESRNCSTREQIEVGLTVINRLHDPKKRYGITLSEIALGYDSFRLKDVNRKVVDNPNQEPVAYMKALKISEGILLGKYWQINNHATHFHHYAISPYWANDRSMEKIGRLELSSSRKSKHVFYREKTR